LVVLLIERNLLSIVWVEVLETLKVDCLPGALVVVDCVLDELLEVESFFQRGVGGGEEEVWVETSKSKEV
jgi:hypothetical protein